jgi:cytoskeletal protein CcmA (bactofilin family)
MAPKLLVLLCAAMSADFSGGKWIMSQEASNGGLPRVTTFDLKVDGTTVTGTVTAPMGGRGGGVASDPAPIAISNGKVNGNTVSFDVVRIFAGNSATTRYECTVSGDTIHVKQTIDLGNGPRTVEGNAKRVAP